VPRSKNA